MPDLDKQVAEALGWEQLYNTYHKEYLDYVEPNGKHIRSISTWHPSTNLLQAVDYLMKPLQESLDWDEDVPEEYIWDQVSEWMNHHYPHIGNTPSERAAWGWCMYFLEVMKGA